MSEGETEERIVQVPLQFIKPLPFNTTVIDAKEKHMLHEEMKKPDGPLRIDPIILRRLTPEEVEEAKEKYPWAKYEIVDGHTRFNIAEDLHWPWIRAKILDVSREEAYEINYRKNKERGRVSQLAEAAYFRHLQADLKMKPYQIGEMFGIGESEVNEILARAVLPKDVRDYITSKLPKAGKQFSSKHLKVIASAPPEKQRVIAEAILEGKLKSEEAEKAKDAIVQGLSKDEAIQAAKAFRGTSKTALVEATAPLFEAPVEITSDITCPKCGAMARVDWSSKRVEWIEG
ncbi:MAG: ParB/RepB/Spo0J family partition protein [Candidatus Bathyarchaeia archaeon]